MLYLIKSSRVQEYHQQNVAIVGSVESERFTISYADRWIADDLKISVGDGCVIVFADTPYDYFVPVRFGVLESVEHEESRLKLEVRVTAPVRAGGTEKLTSLFAKFDRDDPERPGRRFLFRSENPGLESPQSDGDRDSAWTEIIERLSVNGYFERTTFARVRRIVDDRNRPIETGGTVNVGQELVAEIETKTPSAKVESVSLYIESDPLDSVEYGETTGSLPTGLIRLPFSVTASGTVRAAVRVLPEPFKSSRPTIDLHVEPLTRPSVSVVEPVEPRPLSAGPTKQEMAPIVRHFERADLLNDAAWVSLCELLLREYRPDDSAVLSRLSSALFNLGRFSECTGTLKKIAQRRPNEALLLVLSALYANESIDFADHLRRVDLEKESDFDRLLNALDVADRVAVEEVTRILISDMLGDERKSRLIQRVFNQIGNMDFAAELAEIVAYVDPSAGARLLLNRWNAQFAPERAVDLLLDWEAEPAQLTPYFLRKVGALTSAQRWEEMDVLLVKARLILFGQNRAAVCREIGDGFLASESTAEIRKGFDVLLQLINDAIADGEFEIAYVLAQRLAGTAVVVNDPDRLAVAKALMESVLQQATLTAEYLSWLSFVTSGPILRLKPHMQGKSLHLVGGRDFEWLEELEGELNLSNATWHTTEAHGGVNCDWVDGLDRERAVVIVITEFISHALSNLVKDKCDRREITRLDGRPTKRAVLATLEIHFGTRTDT